MTIDPTLLLVFAAILPGLFVSWIGAFAIRAIAPRAGLIDRPASRKVHDDPTPLGGGLAIWLGVVAPFAVGNFVAWWLLSGGAAVLDNSQLKELIGSYLKHLPGYLEKADTLWVILGSGTVLMLVGLADDRWNLGWKVRLGVQFAVAAICVWWQGWQLTAFINVALVTGILSIIWIVAMINSFNMLDNMDGLSGGVATIAAAMLGAVMLSTREDAGDPQYFVGGFLFVIVGAILGFLIHNRPPARIFMGDAGSYFVGFCIAIATLLATYTGYHSKNQLAVLAPVCVMAVPMYDMITVLWIRIREGRSPFQADKSHFSHRLVDLGLTKGQAVLTIYLLTATCGFGALLLRQVTSVGAVVIIMMILCILALIAILETTARRKINGSKINNGS